MEKVATNIAGYSGTPLAKKLGIKPGFKIRLVNAPDNYTNLFDSLPADLIFTSELENQNDLIHFFVTSANEYTRQLLQLKAAIKPNGSIWVSWPKKASKVKMDITEATIRNFALQNGLVDIKVCAVDATWSGLKLVIPVKER